jgi:hypothetical protein
VGLGEGVGCLVGEPVDEELVVFRGTVEFASRSAPREFAGSPLARPMSPFADLRHRRGVTWLKPRVAMEIQYDDLTRGRLRAPVLRQVIGSGAA